MNNKAIEKNIYFAVQTWKNPKNTWTLITFLSVLHFLGSPKSVIRFNSALQKYKFRRFCAKNLALC